YLDGLFANRDYEGLVWLSSMICGSSGFDLQHPSYGLSRSLFLFVESLFGLLKALVRAFGPISKPHRPRDSRTCLRRCANSDLRGSMNSTALAWVSGQMWSRLPESINGSGRTNTRTTRFFGSWLSKTGRQLTSWCADEDGSTRSPWRYDAGVRLALQPAKLRRHASLHYASGAMSSLFRRVVRSPFTTAVSINPRIGMMGQARCCRCR